MSEQPTPTSLAELAGLFLRLGTTAFGGPAAHIALMEEEVVRRRGWLTQQQFLDLLSAANLIPGPNSTELAIHIGYERRGWAGLLLAGTCFILPAMLIVIAFAWAYVRFGTLPALTGVLYGVKPVIVAVVAQALWSLGKSALKTWPLRLVAGAALVLGLLGMNELLLLFAAGLVTGALRWPTLPHKTVPPALLKLVGAVAVLALLPGLLGLGPGAPSATRTALPLGLLPLGLAFVKIGSVLYGSGYVLLAFLDADLVQRFHWLTRGQLLDAVVVGQVTPGPVFTTATFVGYVLQGWRGALVATVGIFLPAFIFVGFSIKLVAQLRQSPLAGAFLDGLNAASWALMAAVSLTLARTALLDIPTGLLALASAFLLLRYKLNSAWLVLGGAALGYGLQQAGLL
ncbi:chromate efflux transporter [Microvirga sp. STR05]|uniref:Chromate efflux transporter n=1 Tax=Hymenobacter duratus TaxID=2771356 RepID=A0ABR8JC55_9BACT|nr:chromate efflux transporter [Hymenobacter duratus]MBD2714345.1 chromate efflux transporter [Hymenobacter duratus]MBR7949248.1 chromate efflux transporter [Microvirga sp. STR05]